MSVTAIDDFDFDVNVLIDEYNTFISKKIRTGKSGHGIFVLVERYDKIYNIIENMPYTQEIIQRVNALYDFSAVIYRVILPGAKYGWHVDSWSESDHNYHIPLITNVNCNFMYMDKIYPMPIGKLYKCMINKLHTFRHDGSDARIHLTFELMKKNSDRYNGFTKRTFDNN